MKKMRKLIAVVLAVTIALTMGTATAFASITIESRADAGTTQENATTYDWYKVFEASINGDLPDVNKETGAWSGDAGKVAYYVTDQTLAGLIDATSVFKTTKVNNSRWNVELENTSATAEQIAAALNTDAIKGAIAVANKGQATANGAQDVTIDGNGNGYYLIVASNGTKLVVQTLGDVTIKEKNTYPSNTKTEDKESAEIGEVVTYTIDVTIPENVANKDIVVVDTITDGLTLNTAANSITVKQGTTDVTTLSWTDKGNGVYNATIPAATVTANKGKTLTLTYTATVNENAVVDEPETNKAHIEYDNFKTVDVEVEVTTFGFELEKVDKDNHSTKLKGVTFSLVNEDGNYYDATANSNPRFTDDNTLVATTDASGKITFAGLHQGEYTLTEIDNPNDGYNMLTAPVKITVAADGKVTADGGSVQGKVVTIENAQGTELPSTGGIGTTIFYILGALLVIGCGVILIARRRMSANN